MTEQTIILADKIDAAGHSMPEAWLRSRVRGWMQVESPGEVWWIGTYTADGVTAPEVGYFRVRFHLEVVSLPPEETP